MCRDLLQNISTHRPRPTQHLYRFVVRWVKGGVHTSVTSESDMFIYWVSLCVLEIRLNNFFLIFCLPSSSSHFHGDNTARKYLGRQRGLCSYLDATLLDWMQLKCLCCSPTCHFMLFIIHNMQLVLRCAYLYWLVLSHNISSQGGIFENQAIWMPESFANENICWCDATHKLISHRVFLELLLLLIEWGTALIAALPYHISLRLRSIKFLYCSSLTITMAPSSINMRLRCSCVNRFLLLCIIHSTVMLAHFLCGKWKTRTCGDLVKN